MAATRLHVTTIPASLRLVEVASPEPQVPRLVRLPGGATVDELWYGLDAVTLTLTGELDLYDRAAFIDVLTGALLAGARRITLDANHLSFASVGVLRAILRTRRFLMRQGGSLDIAGMRPALARVWELLLASNRPGERPTA